MNTIFNSFVPAKSNFNNILDGFFNRSIGDIVGSDFVITQPSVNVVETTDAYEVEVAAPGLEKKDFTISIEQDQMLVAVEKEATNELKEGESFTRREFSFSSFNRSFYLPDTVNTEAISATYKNGILFINVPKKEEAKEQGPKTIEIS